MITNQVVTRVYSTMEEVMSDPRPTCDICSSVVCADINTITAKFYIYKKTDPEKIRLDEEIVVCNTCHSIYKKIDKYIKH